MKCNYFCREERNIDSRRVECWSTDAVKTEGTVQTRKTSWYKVWRCWLGTH